MSDEHRWRDVAEVIVATCATSTREASVPVVQKILSHLVAEVVQEADRQVGVVVDGMADLGTMLKRSARTERPLLPLIAALALLEEEVRSMSEAQVPGPVLAALNAITIAREGRS